MKIQIHSDIHLEFGSDVIIEPLADTLVLSGDIIMAKHLDGANIQSSLYKEFFIDVSKKFKDVIYVLGNHEHYRGNIEETKTIIEKFLQSLKIDNIHVLEQSSMIIEDVLFIGGTLWTNCNNDDWFTKQHLKDNMNDFNIIKKSNGTFRPEDSIKIHERTLDYFKNVVRNNPNSTICIVSHHAPCFKSIHERYKNDYLMNGGFYSELSEFILDNENIKLWIHGHMHDHFNYEIGSCNVICNPVGYPNENKPLFTEVVEI